MGTPIPNSKIEQQTQVNNEVTTYFLTKEEIAARYGPPVPRDDSSNPYHERVIEAVKCCETLEEAAEMIGTTPSQLNHYLGVRNIFPKWANKSAEEVDEMSDIKAAPVKSRADVLRTHITKEEYIHFKNKNLSDRAILKKVSLDDVRWLPALTTLKKDWGLAGFKAGIPETMTEAQYQEQKQAAEAIGAFLERLGLNLKFPLIRCKPFSSVEIEPRNDTGDDDIEWAVPFKPVDKRAIISITAKSLILNSQAQADMVGVTNVRVGVSRGKLVIKPCEDKSSYTLSRNETSKIKGSSAKIGGGSLVKFLLQRGLKIGKYPLVKNDDKNWWEAEGLEA